MKYTQAASVNHECPLPTQRGRPPRLSVYVG
jgi:hypothetical protein